MLTKEEKLDQLLFDEGIKHREKNLGHARGIYYKDANGKTIFTNRTLDDLTRLWVKAHELGHHYSHVEGDLFYVDPIIAGRSEERAQRWALQYLMPLKSLIAAYENGVQSMFELANYLELPEKEVQKGLQLYTVIYGEYATCCGYTIYWRPFRIARPNETLYATLF